MNELVHLASRVTADVARTFATVWPFLLLAVIAAAAVPVYVGIDRVSDLLRRRWHLATLGAVALATLTPFCSCGTTAILLGMLATSAPWAPLVAFMVSSPLTSPSELVFSAGLFGWPFALLFFGGTMALGLLAGGVAHVLDRAGWLAGQARMDEHDDGGGGCGAAPRGEDRACGDATASTTSTAVAARPQVRPAPDRYRLRELTRALMTTGKRLVVFFFAYTAIGYLVIEAVPTSWLTDHLGSGSLLAVPLAALVGIPAYINTEGSLPLVAAMVDSGMGAGPALAFIITGAGTSIGAITGLFVIARARVVGLVVALLFSGALVLGWTGQLVL